MAARAVGLLRGGVPAETDRPVRMLTVRPHGLFENIQSNGDEHPLSDHEFRAGLGRLMKVATDGGWNVYGFRYKWERDEPVAHFGFLTTEVVKRRPDAVITKLDGKPADMLIYEALDRGTLGAVLGR